MTFYVRVVNDEGDPRTVKVTAFFGILNGFLEEYTDDDGWATFNTSKEYDTAHIYADGEDMGDISISDEERMSFTVNYGD